MKYEKNVFLEYSVLQKNTPGCLWECFVCVNKLWMYDACPVEKDLYRVQISPFIILFRDTQAPILLDTTFHEGSP